MITPHSGNIARPTPMTLPAEQLHFTLVSFLGGFFHFFKSEFVIGAVI